MIKNSVVLTVGTIVNSLLGLFFYILVARNLAISDFGYFSFLLGLGVLASEIGDLGLGSAIIKFAHGERFRSVLSLVFVQRLIMGIFLVTLAVIIQFFFPANFLLSALVAWFLLWLSAITQAFLAMQKFMAYIIVNIFGNLIRLGIIFLLFSRLALTTETAIGAFIIATLFSLGLGVLFLKLLRREPLLELTGLKQTIKEIFGFSSWLSLSFAVSALAAKLDNPLIYLLGGAQAAGVYASAQKLSSALPQIAVSLEGVFSPRLAVNDQNKKPFGTYLFLAVLAGLGLIMLIPFSTLIITLIFGQKYLPASGPFQLIMLGMALFFLSGPFSAGLLYRFGKSNIHFIASVLQLAVTVLLYLLLIPGYGASGAAAAFVAGQFINLLLTGGLYYYLNNEHKK